MTPNQQISYKAGVTADIQITREENSQTRHQGFHTEKVDGTSHLLQGSMGSHCRCQNIPKSQQALENVPGSCLFPKNTFFDTIQPHGFGFFFVCFFFGHFSSSFRILYLPSFQMSSPQIFHIRCPPITGCAFNSNVPPPEKLSHLVLPASFHALPSPHPHSLWLTFSLIIWLYLSPESYHILKLP